MDRLIYVGMTAAKHTMAQLEATSQNIANVETTGFKADISMFKAIPVYGPGNPTREFVVNSVVGTDFTPGVITQTGNPTDLAVTGQGWFTLKLPDGSEAYTRDGSFRVDTTGQLQSASGIPVMGENGTISIPPNMEVSIAKDGTVSAVPSGSNPGSVSVLGRLKLVNPPEQDIEKGADNLFRTKNGKPAAADASVRVASGSLESSNVNMVESMISMINLGRAFDMQMKLLQSADNNASKASALLNINA